MSATTHRETTNALQMQVPGGHTVVWQNRYRGHADLDPRRLLQNPLNAHVHPEFQQKAMRGALTEIGWLDSIKVAVEPWAADVPMAPDDPLAIYLHPPGDPTADGAWWRMGAVFNGHMRTVLALQEGQAQAPVDFYELTPEEALFALLTYDAIGAQAYMSAQNTSAILDRVRIENEAVRALVARSAREAGVIFAASAPAQVGPVPVAGDTPLPGGLTLPAPVVPDAAAPQVGRGIQDPAALEDMEAPGARGKTPQESEMAYLTHTIKQVVLYFGHEEYLDIIRRLRVAGDVLETLHGAEDRHFDNNTQIVLYVLAYWEQHEGAEDGGIVNAPADPDGRADTAPASQADPSG